MALVDFEKQVIDRSREVPVVVDFWAPWCGPCRVLGPAIEQLAAEDSGRWELVKINTDEQPELAADWGIMGIPAVKLFRDGQIAGEFVGALPASEIRSWLDSFLPDPNAKRLESLLDGWERRPTATLVAELERLREERPDLAEVPLRLAQAVVFDDPVRARQLLAEADGDGSLAEPAADVASLAELMQLEGEIPQALREPLDAARSALRERDFDRTFERLVDAVGVDRGFADELARRAAVALFHLLGHHHELTLKHQRRLAMALHA